MADVAVVFEGGLARTLAVLPLLIAISIAGCGSKGSAVGHKAQRSLVAGGCGATRLYLGSPPAWTAAAFSDSSNPPPPIPYGIADGGDAVAVVFGYPLRAGNPTDPANKVLWIMRLPRHHSPLTIEARPLRARRPTVRAAWPADSSPGEIYPSYVNVPTAGCWRLTLRWAGHTDWIDLHYRS